MPLDKPKSRAMHYWAAMHPPPRLKWRKGAGRFAAYPSGAHQPNMIAIVTPPVHANASWPWRVTWPGWFLEQGYGLDKQAAAERLQYVEELKQDALPPQAKNLMANLSQELFGAVQGASQ